MPVYRENTESKTVISGAKPAKLSFDLLHEMSEHLLVRLTKQARSRTVYLLINTTKQDRSRTMYPSIRQNRTDLG